MPLMFFWHNDQPIRYETVKAQLASVQQLPSATEVKVDAIDLRDYDVLLERIDVYNADESNRE